MNKYNNIELPGNLHINTLDYSKWWDAISGQLINKDDSDQLSQILNQITSHFYRNPLLKDVRVLVVMGKNEPNTVIPYFKKALDKNNSSLASATIMEINMLSKLYFEELIPLYEQVFEGPHTNAQWLAILNLLNLVRIFPKQVGGLLKHLLQEKEELTIINDAKETTFFRQGKDIKLIKHEFNEIFTKAEDKLQWAIVLDLIDYARKKPQNTEDFFLKALKSNFDNVKWSALLGIIELTKIHPEQFGLLLTQILYKYPPLPLCDSPRILIEMSRDKSSLKNVLNVLQRAAHSNNPYLKWTALAELIMVNRIAPCLG